MKQLKQNILLVVLMIVACTPSSTTSDQTTEHEIKQAIEATGLAVREAFKNGDLETISLYHHPDVVKALNFKDLKRGRNAVLEGLKSTMATYDLEFLNEKTTETFIHNDNLVVKQVLFALRLIPKNGDPPFTFRGRSLLVLQRYDKSPTGWATIQEIIQPYED